MEIKQFVFLLKRWFWLLILGLVLGAVSGVLISRIQTPVYQATAKILVMRVPDQSLSGLSYLGDQQLAQTFSELITTVPVITDASNQLGFKIDPSQIQIQQNTNSQIIKVIAEDNDPQRCVTIANTLVETAITHYVGLQVGQYSSVEKDIQTQLNFMQTRIFSMQSNISETSQTIINNQKEQIQSQMSPLQNEVSQLQQDIAQLSPATTAQQKTLLAQKQTRLDQIQPLLTAYQAAYSNLVVLNVPIDDGSIDENNLLLLQKTLEVYRQNYVDLTGKLASLQQSHVKGISNVTKIQDATVPKAPVRPQILINTMLTTAVGLILAFIAIFLMENLDITLKFPAIKRKPYKNAIAQK
jgi:capsular polysaccharide biosynthesis protein